MIFAPQVLLLRRLLSLARLRAGQAGRARQLVVPSSAVRGLRGRGGPEGDGGGDDFVHSLSETKNRVVACPYAPESDSASLLPTLFYSP